MSSVKAEKSFEYIFLLSFFDICLTSKSGWFYPKSSYNIFSSLFLS